MPNAAEEVAALIKSVLQSTKEDVSLEMLRKDFRKIIGYPIPYASLGFRNLEDFIRSDLCSHAVALFQDRAGVFYCRSVADSSTAHIENLVSGQNQRVARRRPLIPVTAPTRRPLLPNPTWRRPQTFEDRHSIPQTSNFAERALTSAREQGAQTSSVSTNSKPYDNARTVSPPTPTTAALPALPVAAAVSNAAAPRAIRKYSPIRAPVENHYTDAPVNGSGDVRASVRPKLKKKLTYKEILEKYCQEKAMALPRYNTSSLEKGVGSFVCRMTVAGKSYYTYPDEKPTPKEAEEEAAKLAVDSLNLLKEVPIMKVSDNEYTVICRVKTIVARKSNGIFSNAIKNEYKMIHCEELPKNWMELLKTNPGLFQIDIVDDHRAIISPAKAKPEMSRSLSDISDDCRSTDSASSHAPDIVLPDSDTWDVYVTHATSAVDVYVRLIGENYSEKYEEMATDMDLHYSYNNGSAPSQVTSSSLCAAKYDVSWHRVEIISVDNGNKEAQCYFVDNGDTDPVPIEFIQILEPQFCSLPYQAIHCKLAGLEGHAKNDTMRCSVMDIIVGNTCVARIVDRDNLSIVLYDTTTETDVDLNRKILEKAVDSNILPQLDLVGKVFITHCRADGDFWVQRDNPGFSLLMDLIDELTPKIQTEPEPDAKDVSFGKLYLAMYSEDDNWYRARITDIEDDKFKVFFVDFGNEDTVSLKHLRDLGAYPKLVDIPQQGIHCRLHDVPSSKDLEWIEETKNKFQEIAPTDVPLILKMISSGLNDVHEVQLFKRMEANNELVSINATLSEDVSIFKKRPVEKSLNSPLRRMSKTSTTSPTHVKKMERRNSGNVSFSQLSVPAVGSQVDVHITLAASPSNFSCQLCSDGELFDRMMLTMNVFYNQEENRVKVSKESIVPGKPFACHHCDDVWYRAEISTVENSSSEPMIYAYFVDYGDFGMTSLTRLQPLLSKFMELPKQAIAASLAGVVPTHGDWTPEACYYFKGLVEERQFVAMVKNKNKNAQSVETMHIQLVDTSKQYCDKYIHTVLVKAGQAVLEEC